MRCALSLVSPLVSPLILTLVMMLGALACDAEHSPSSTLPPAQKDQHNPREGRVIARVGEESITTVDLARWIAELPPITRSRYQRRERQREALEAMIRLKLLAHLAREAGYHQDPSVALAGERALAEQLGLSAQDLQEQLSALTVRRAPPPSLTPSPSPAPSEASREDHTP